MSYLGKRLVNILASTGGDGTGDTNAVGDYSSETEVFYYQPAADEIVSISRMIVSIEDAGAPDSGKYGNNITLTNGIVVRLSDSSGVVNTLTGFNILTNGQWAAHCHDLTQHTSQT